MLINDLPDDCLIEIFQRLQPIYLEDFAKLSKVCLRWEELILRRLNKVRYIVLPGSYEPYQYKVIEDPSLIQVRDPSFIPDLDLALLVPNLKIIDYFAPTDPLYSLDVPHKKSPKELEAKDLIKIIEETPSCKGIVMPWRVGYYDDLKTPLNLEMVALSLKCQFQLQDFVPDRLTQLYLTDTHLEFIANINFQPNMIRLHIEMTHSTISNLYLGPIFPKLKILELNTVISSSNNFMLHFIDYCPSLESAYLVISFVKKPTVIMNFNLKNLVLYFNYSGDDNPLWPVVVDLLSKFPNLENLSMRYSWEINDIHIAGLVQLLPRLKLMDFRGSPGVTEESAKYLMDFCSKNKREPITFYYNRKDLPSSWPKILDDVDEAPRICKGMDFMKFCFFTDYQCLPIFLDPEP